MSHRQARRHGISGNPEHCFTISGAARAGAGPVTSEPGRLTLFVDPEMTVLTPEDMGTNWVILCRDEVYVRDRIAVEKIIGIVAHPADAHSILAEFLPEFQRLGIPLQLYDGTTVWSPERRTSKESSTHL